MDLISRKSLIDKLDPLYKQKKETAPNNLAEGFMQVDGLIRREPSAFEGMTYGEVIQAVFPNLKYTRGDGFTMIEADNHATRILIWDSFWDSSYKGVSE